MKTTKIEWTQSTWNPVGGCRRVSPGCQNCYAERQAHRMAGSLNRKVWQRYAGLTRITNGRPGWTGSTFFDEEVLLQPLRTRKPTTYFISLSDLFYAGRPPEYIDRVFAVMALCPQHTFQILTKYADRMLAYFEDIGYRQEQIGIEAERRSGLYRYICDGWLPRWKLPLPNVHLGVSVEDQQRADERIPLLLRTPAALRFVSYEPAIGAVDFENIQFRAGGTYSALHDHDGFGMLGAEHKALDWVIVGGESGPGSRPFNIAWARRTVRQCREAGVSVFVKQLGAFPVIEPCRQHHYDFGEAIGRKARFSAIDPLHPSTGMWRVHFKDRKGGDMSEWPEDLRVREMPR